MTRRRAIVLLALAAPLAAALFGAAHAQLSFSVGASFFHDLRFDALGLPPGLHNRAGAALAGMAGAWWLGLVLALPLLALFSVLLRRGATLFAVGGGAIALGLILALVGAMGGLLIGMLAPGFDTGTATPAGIEDAESYLRAALMHRGAALGAALTLPVGAWIAWQAARVERARAGQPAP